MKVTMKIRTYSELIKIPDFEGRFNYLDLHSTVGADTFGFDRWMNQMFYRSYEWKSRRREIILRDSNGTFPCDLGCFDRPIDGGIIIVHHMNPISPNDIQFSTEYLLNPEYLITTLDLTHRAIHYGGLNLAMSTTPIERKPNDTCPWR